MPAGLTLAQQDTMMAAATAALTIDNGTNDVDCNLTLSRLPFNTIFTGGSHIINTAADFAGVVTTTAYVAIVEQINFCGLSGVFGGCATQNSRGPFVLARATAIGIQQHSVVTGDRISNSAPSNPTLG